MTGRAQLQELAQGRIARPTPRLRNSQDLWIGVSRDLLITTL
jgi:hypothetical protein